MLGSEARMLGARVQGVRIRQAHELGVLLWRGPGGSLAGVVTGGFVKAALVGDVTQGAAPSETVWVHVGQVLPGGEIVGVLEGPSVVFPQLAGRVGVVLRPSEVLGVLDASTDWVPDLWESGAPKKWLGEAPESRSGVRQG